MYDEEYIPLKKLEVNDSVQLEYKNKNDNFHIMWNDVEEKYQIEQTSVYTTRHSFKMYFPSFSYLRYYLNSINAEFVKEINPIKLDYVEKLINHVEKI